MKLNKISFLLILIFLFSVVGVSAWNSSNENNYITSFGNFNEGLSSTEDSIAVFGAVLPILIEDLDGDGINEIIMVSGTQIKLFQNTSMTSITAISHGCDVDETWNIILNDFGDDGNKDILLNCNLGDQTKVLFFSFDGSILTLDNTLVLANYDGEGTIGCDDIRDICFASFSVSATAKGVNYDAWGVGFNSTSKGSDVSLYAAGGGQIRVCNPVINEMAVKDYDGNGDINFIVSQIIYRSGDQHIVTNFVNVTKDLNANVEMRISTDTWAFNDFGCLVGRHKSYGTSPLVHNLDPTVGLETVIGVQTSEDEFKMIMYDSQGNELITFPSIFEAAGDIISNVILGNFFEDTGNNDVCVMGYDNVSKDIDLLCGNSEHSRIPFVHAEEYFFDTGGRFEISKDYTSKHIITHTANQKQQSHDLNEVINAYGVFELDYQGILGDDLIMLYPSPADESSQLLLYDYEQIGLTDLIVATATNVYYIDDGFTNKVGYIDSVTIDPCTSSVWKVNTSVDVTLVCKDFDGDQVTTMSYLYYGESFQQNGTSMVAASGTTFPFLFIANETGAAYQLRVECSDVENPTEIHSEIYLFSVSTNGVENGDCITSDTPSAPDGSGAEDEAPVIVGESCDTSDDCPTGTVCDDITDTCVLPTPPKQSNPDNSINTGVRVLSGMTGLGSTLLWLVIMGIVAWAVVQNWGFTHDTMPYILILELVLLIVGTVMGFIPLGYIIALALVGILIIGAWFRLKFVGSNTGS